MSLAWDVWVDTKEDDIYLAVTVNIYIQRSAVIIAFVAELSDLIMQLVIGGLGEVEAGGSGNSHPQRRGKGILGI